MVRPIAFDRAKVLDSAISVFIEKGYHEASIAELCDATGLLRGSIYAAFSSKRGLFLSSIEAYFESLEFRSFFSFQRKHSTID